ncbi:N-acetylmuramoyl-L-alanine amidase [Cognatishimia activa]|uniref:N-acetylmuramoyl-L-alanine amidase n=1 Tax=Cognatishimia activa TaxID=1715691 RepID=UPI0022309FCF|nr:N-acetylmuramoyl-L-alanine amidase [Cognatishimia activa]UZD92077.1 N-acetylmuramoyl-L-alanine amidase [Cognatishimia activa]
MSRFLKILAFAGAAILGTSVFAQDFSGLARLDVSESQIVDQGKRRASIDLALSQGVPWRVFTLDAPRRLVIDFREVDWTGVTGSDLLKGDNISEVRVGGFRPGWSRLVADLASPMLVETAEMKIDPSTSEAQLRVKMFATDAESFASRSGAPYDPRWDLPKPVVEDVERPEKSDWAATVVVLDPGHGGVDPGAERGGVQEKALMLTFARELRDTLRRAGGFEVVLTRNEDVFVSLERRVAIAHEVSADIFVSLHADTVQQGQAHGATVYTLSEKASDAASQYLAERHDRSDVLAGIDLTGTDDLIANVLLDLVRRETEPRSERLAKAMVLGLQGTIGELNRKPYRQAGFSVLKAADIPSVLIEVGFMSSARDLENLTDAEWRARAAEGIRDGLQAWVIADKAARNLVRQ